MKQINWLIKKLEVFFEFVNALKKDKWLHIIGGLLIFALCLWKLPIDNENGLFGASWTVVLFAGAFKEIVIDKWCRLGTPEWNDFYATIAIPTFITAGQLIAILVQK